MAGWPVGRLTSWIAQQRPLRFRSSSEARSRLGSGSGSGLGPWQLGEGDLEAGPSRVVYFLVLHFDLLVASRQKDFER